MHLLYLKNPSKKSSKYLSISNFKKKPSLSYKIIFNQNILNFMKNYLKIVKCKNKNLS